MTELLQKFVDWLNDDVIEPVIEWLYDFALWLIRKIWEEVANAIATAFEALPAPDFLQDVSGAFMSIDPGVMFFADVLQLPEGTAIVVSAYTGRFIIRRLPVIG